MKYCRFLSPRGPQFGLIEMIAGEPQVTHELEGVAIPDLKKSRKTAAAAVSALKLLYPCLPSKIVCVGRNYRAHAKELGNEVPVEPLIFLKPPSSLISPGENIVRPRSLSQRVDYEGELAVVMGATCSRVKPEEDVKKYILGYACANDVTARDLQNKDGQWTRAKGFDTFCPLGPVVTDEIDPWRGVRLETRVNGQVKQSAGTQEFIFSLDVIIRYISSVMTLLPGDLICTGTPAGVGPLAAGDQVEIAIEGVGTLKNPVVDGD